jgi:hypothetical protein
MFQLCSKGDDAMTDQIKQALAALGEDFALCSLSLDEFLTIRLALESAAEEQACWGAIEEWVDSGGDCWGVELFKGHADNEFAGWWFAQPKDGDNEPVGNALRGLTRLLALRAAAEWCGGQK